jgi:hypothetical protein
MNQLNQVCKNCNQEKPIWDFYPGHGKTCMQCKAVSQKEYLKEYRQRPEVKQRERARMTSEEYKRKRNARLQAQRKARQELKQSCNQQQP